MATTESAQPVHGMILYILPPLSFFCSDEAAQLLSSTSRTSQIAAHVTNTNIHGTSCRTARPPSTILNLHAKAGELQERVFR